MRSACCGARSGRSLMMIRPLVVSITTELALSRPAGSGAELAGAWAAGACAKAGAAKTSAAATATMRIMDTPDQVMPGSTGELGLQASSDHGRDEGRDVAAHRCDLPDQCGGDRADADRSRKKYRFDVGRHGLVHAGNLHLVIEIGAVAQSADHDGGADRS